MSLRWQTEVGRASRDLDCALRGTHWIARALETREAPLRGAPLACPYGRLRGGHEVIQKLEHHQSPSRRVINEFMRPRIPPCCYHTLAEQHVASLLALVSLRAPPIDA